MGGQREKGVERGEGEGGLMASRAGHLWYMVWKRRRGEEK